MADDSETRMAIERKIVRRVVTDLIAAKYSLDLDDGGDELALRRSLDVEEVCAAMHTVDEERLIARGADGKTRGMVYFVYGNDGWDAINDYSTSLDSIMEPILRWCDEQESARLGAEAEAPALWQWLVVAIDPDTGDNADLLVTASDVAGAVELWRAYYEIENALERPAKVFQLPPAASQPQAHVWGMHVPDMLPDASAA